MIFSDTFSGDGAFLADWSQQGFGVGSRVNDQASLPEYCWLRVVNAFDSSAHVVEYDHISGTVQIGVSSSSENWEYQRPTGYIVSIRGDGVVECFADEDSLGYSFITVSPGSRVKVEHNGDHIVNLYDDDVLIRSWDNSASPTSIGNYVWLAGGNGVADNFMAMDVGGGEPTLPDTTKFFQFL